MSLLHIGDIAGGRAHHDRAIALYDPAEHRALATRFGQDVRMALLSFRSLALWILGYPDRALADANHAIMDAREIGQAASLMYALTITPMTLIPCGHYDAAKAQSDEVIPLAEEKGATLWKAIGMTNQGYVMALTGRASDAVHAITSGIRLGGQRDQHYGCPCIYRIWVLPMRNLTNLMTLGAALSKQ
jgi:hypothetical protein